MQEHIGVTSGDREDSGRKISRFAKQTQMKQKKQYRIMITEPRKKKVD